MFGAAVLCVKVQVRLHRQTRIPYPSDQLPRLNPLPGTYREAGMHQVRQQHIGFAAFQPDEVSGRMPAVGLRGILVRQLIFDLSNDSRAGCVHRFPENVITPQVFRP